MKISFMSRCKDQLLRLYAIVFAEKSRMLSKPNVFIDYFPTITVSSKGLNQAGYP